jgi:hypothetical protein
VPARAGGARGHSLFVCEECGVRLQSRSVRLAGGDDLAVGRFEVEAELAGLSLLISNLPAIAGSFRCLNSGNATINHAAGFA